MLHTHEHVDLNKADLNTRCWRVSHNKNVVNFVNFQEKIDTLLNAASVTKVYLLSARV